MPQGAADRIEIIRADITTLPVDAIVNAANESLLGGGGVDGAIHRAAGPGLLDACRRIGGCPTGEARLTPGFNLPAEYVIHTVGPVYRDGKHGEPALLQRCYESSLQLALEHRVKTIAFPAISCGVYGYPIEDAAAIALSTTMDFLASNAAVERVTFALFDDRARSVYQKRIDALAD